MDEMKGNRAPPRIHVNKPCTHVGTHQDYPRHRYRMIIYLTFKHSKTQIFLKLRRRILIFQIGVYLGELKVSL